MPKAVIASPSDQRFRPARRLHTPREYAAVFSERSIQRSACFDLLRGRGAASGAAGGVAVSRLGLVIPKRLARHAVLRNLIKRQARECFRRFDGCLPATDLVLRLARWPQGMTELVAQPRCLKAALRNEIGLLLARANG